MYDRIKDHLGLILAALGVFLVAFRLFTAARYDADTALAILQASGTGNVVVGAVTTLLPKAATYACILSIVAVVLIDDRRARQVAFTAGAIPAFIVVVTPADTMTPVLVLGWALSPVGRLMWENSNVPEKEARSTRDWWKRWAAVVLAVLVVAGSTSDNTMWLPIETVRTSTDVQVGYVLSSTTDETTLLVYKGRRVVHVGPLTKRALCRPKGRKRARSIAAWLRLLPSEPRYPVCDESLV